jgi:predicted DCC family thiol-disulfide oxidoreductase YuxK
MTDSSTQGPAGGEGQHLLLYDGVCGLCDHLVQFVLAHDPRGVFDFAPLQSATGRAAVAREGGDPDASPRSMWFATTGCRTHAAW